MKPLKYVQAGVLCLRGVIVATTGHAAPDCTFPGQPATDARVGLDAFADGFKRPVKIVSIPAATGVEAYYVVEQAGLIKRIERTPQGGWTQRPAADLRDRVTAIGGDTDERGLLGLTLHPGFANNARLFVNYTTRGALKSRISEFRVKVDGTVDVGHERLLLEFAQPFVNHNGGDLAFGPDGMLYIATGDGGSGGDPHGNGQSLRTVLGKILRVDAGDGGPGLATVPLDNPFVNQAGKRGEIWAYGLRNPWRIAFDRATGELWAGDVGQDALEEIDIIKKGANYGWNIMEGEACYGQPDCDRTGLELPIFQYRRGDGYSVTGGHVYRGTRIAGLTGAYVFGDYGSGNIWALRRNGSGSPTATLILASGRSISSFGEDAAGELLVLDHARGAILRLVPRTGPPTNSTFPQRLSQSGCFSSLTPLMPMGDLVPYQVAAPLWSDGLSKDRYFKLPNGRRWTKDQDGSWVAPTGTVLIKHFRVPTPNGSASVETRVLVKRDSGIFDAYTYQWSDDGTDATLLAGASTKRLSIFEDQLSETFDYYLPSPSDCRRCHAPNFAGQDGSRGLLGLTSKQLNIRVPREGQEVNQLQWLLARGAIDATLATGAPEPFPNPSDVEAALALRARTWLHVQCADCHHPGGSAGQTTMDLRASVQLSRTHTCNELPKAGDLGIPGALILVPGRPDLSLLGVRIGHPRLDQRMPPIANQRPDKPGAALVRAWIASLDNCDAD